MTEKSLKKNLATKWEGAEFVNVRQLGTIVVTRSDSFSLCYHCSIFSYMYTLSHSRSHLQEIYNNVILKGNSGL
jgi:hypothetical protein